jgi:agmatine deiminase
MPSPTPRELGYRMPAEWAPHTATWLSWPHPDGISFPDRYDEVLPAFAEMVRVLAEHEPVNINVCDAEMEAEVRHYLLEHKVPSELFSPTQSAAHATIHFVQIPTDEPWCRDHGPIFVSRAAREQPLAIVDWKFNAWGGKFLPFDDDDAVARRIAHVLKLPLFSPDMVLEGGSIDVNGAGTLLTTEVCLLNPNRNPHLSKAQIEQHLKDYLGVTNILWLGEGIVGDDTDGHVDDIARFVNPTTVVTIVEQDKADVNYAALQENLKRLRAMKDQNGRPLRIVELPMPGVVKHKSQRLPASYANFYIANGVVLLPVYRHKNDAIAQEILQKLFPDRRVVPIDSTELIWGRGSFHCLSQQQPAVPHQ